MIDHYILMIVAGYCLGDLINKIVRIIKDK